MASRRISIRNQNGFTLIELLVVIAIFAILSTLGLFFSMDFYRTYGANAEVNTLVSALAKARNQSLANINEKEHGVHVETDKYIVFERSVYGALASDDLVIPSGSSAVPAGVTTIIFERLTGKARQDNGSACPCTVNLTSQSITKTIVVNSEGGLEW
jgi:prepilin-type N-terminal cleavage/methylation domain-containing protein